MAVPERPRCCGALHLHTGYDDAAKRLAKQTIEQFEDCDHVAANAAGCGSAMKDYGHLFDDDPDWAERALAFAAKVRDVSELLAGEPRAPRHPLPLRVAYHDACHLAHAQALRAEPRALLRTIPGLELVEPAEWEICCGSAGVYNLLQPGRGLRARQAKGCEPRRHGGRGHRRRQSWLYLADREPPESGGEAASDLPPRGARPHVDRGRQRCRRFLKESRSWRP